MSGTGCNGRRDGIGGDSKCRGDRCMCVLGKRTRGGSRPDDAANSFPAGFGLHVNSVFCPPTVTTSPDLTQLVLALSPFS